MAQQGEDCYFFYNASCAKGLACAFRHQAAALGKEQVCAAWLEGSCTDVACSSRHTKVQPKTRSDVPCFYETQPSGCRKANCIFRHVRREQLDESLNVLPKLDLQAWTKPSVQFPVFLQKQATADIPSIKHQKIVINTQEESDQESVNGSPVKQSAPVELKEEDRTVPPKLIVKGKRLLLDGTRNKDNVEERVKVIDSERLEKTSEIVADTEVKDDRAAAERAKIFKLKTSAVTHAASNVGSNEATQDITKDSAGILDHGIDLGIKSLEQIQRQRAIESMKRHVHNRVVESQEQLQAPSSRTTVGEDSPQKRATVRKYSPQRREEERENSSETTPPRFETRKPSEEISPRKILNATRATSPERFTTKTTSQNVSPSRSVSRETSLEDISPRRFADRDSSNDESSPSRLKAKLLRVVSPRKIVTERTFDDVSPRKFARRDKADEFSSRRVVVSRYNSSEDSNSEDEQNKPTKPVVKTTRPSAKARLGWKSPDRSGKDIDPVSKNERCVAAKFETRLGRDRNNEEYKTSRKNDTNSNLYKNKSRSRERSEVRENPRKRVNSPEVREHLRKRVKSPVVLRARRSLSDDSEDAFDLGQSPSPSHRGSSPLHSTSHRNRSRDTDKLQDTRLKIDRSTRRNRSQEAEKLQDTRLNKVQLIDARLRITKKPHHHRRIEKTHDEVVVGEKSPASRDQKKPVVVPLSSIVIPTRRIFLDDGLAPTDKDKSGDDSSSESTSKPSEPADLGKSSQVICSSESGEANKTSLPVIRGIKSANVRRLQLERARQTKQASEPPQTALPTTEVHVKLVDKTVNVAERARLTTVSTSPAIVIRTLDEIKREKEEKLRRKQTESESSEKSSESRKRRHGVVELYRPPSMLRKEALTESLREKRSIKHYNDISHNLEDKRKVNKHNANFNDEPKISKHKTTISVSSSNKPKVIVDDRRSSASHKEMDWSNVRSYAEIMADKKAKLLQASTEPNISKCKRSHESSPDDADSSRKSLKSDRVLTLDHSSSSRSLQSTVDNISLSDRQQQQFKPIVLDANAITTIRIPSRPFARKRLKKDDVKKENAIDKEAAYASEDIALDNNDKLGKYSKMADKTSEGTANKDIGMTLDVENRLSASDVNGVGVSESRPQSLTGRRRISKMSNSDTGISENINKSGRRPTSTEGELLPDADDIFSDSFLCDLTQFPALSDAADNVPIDDDDDFLQEMKDLLS